MVKRRRSIRRWYRRSWPMWRRDIEDSLRSLTNWLRGRGFYAGATIALVLLLAGCSPFPPAVTASEPLCVVYEGEGQVYPSATTCSDVGTPTRAVEIVGARRVPCAEVGAAPEPHCAPDTGTRIVNGTIWLDLPAEACPGRAL